MSVPHVVILGGGFGGLSAARTFRNQPVRVTLIDRRNHHLFQPLLYQVATATLSPGDIAAPIRWIFRHQRNLRVLLGEARSVDVAARRIQLEDGATLEYDYLLVATGASHAYFGHPEWAEHAPGLKTLEDALLIRRRVLLAFERAERETDPARQQELLTFVIVGGGPTGVELAGTLAEIAHRTLRDEFRSIDTARARIVLVEAGPTILSAFPERLRDAARRSLGRLRVEVREGAAVTHIDGRGVNLGGERLTAGTIIWAAGVAASPVVATQPVERVELGRKNVRPEPFSELEVSAGAVEPMTLNKLFKRVADRVTPARTILPHALLLPSSGNASGSGRERPAHAVTPDPSIVAGVALRSASFRGVAIAFVIATAAGFAIASPTACRS